MLSTTRASLHKHSSPPPKHAEEEVSKVGKNTVKLDFSLKNTELSI